MYKWHIHSAIGRGKPIANDLTRATDGIAASLRQFSISASRAAEDRGNEAPRPTRSERSAEAVKEVSSLAPRPARGIDARSLAAKPPQGFTIRRLDTRPVGSEGPIRGSGGGRAPGSTRGRGGLRGGARGGTRGGALRGRGGRGTRARSKGKRDGDRKKKQKFNDDYVETSYTEEEKEYIYNTECGWPAPYNPTTSAETLASLGPPTISSPTGVKETITYKMQVAAGSIAGGYRHAGVHLGKINRGDGMSFFESVEQKQIAQSFKKQKKKQISGPMAEDFGRSNIGGLSTEDRAAMLKAWVGGQYQAPLPADKGDVLGQVDSFLRRNETYLPEDLRKLESKLSTLLPSAKPKARNVKAAV